MSWKKVKLGEVVKQYRIEHRVQNETTYKQVSILNDGSVVLRGEKIGKEIGRKRQFLIDLEKYPKTLLFTRQLLLQGSIGLANKEVHNCIVTENMPMFSVVDKIVDVDYLINFIKSLEFKNQVKKIELTGSAQKSIHEKTFLQLEIPLPSLDEQRKIVTSLQNRNSKVVELSTELTHQLTLLKKLRQQLLQDAVQGKLLSEPRFIRLNDLPDIKNQSNHTNQKNHSSDTGHKFLQKIKEEKEKLSAQKKLKKEKELPPITADEIPFEIPENWVWCRLGEICDKIHYGFNASAKPEKKDVRLLRITDIQENKVDWESVPGCDYSNNDLINYLLNENDIVIARTGGTIGKTFLVKDITVKSLFASYLIRVIPSKNISPEYLKHFLESPIYWKQLYDAAWGAGQLNVNGTSLSNLAVPLPPLSQQHLIVQKLETLMQHCNNLETSIQQSQTQNQQLLQQVLREALRK